MNKKLYPKTVVNRKWLIGAAAFAVAGIMMIILYNLYVMRQNQASHTQTTKSQQAPATATEADTVWIDKQAARKPAIATTHRTPLVATLATESAPIAAQPATQAPDVKAMSAPINSNQITNDQSANNPPSPLSSTAPPITGTGTSPLTDDQNMQGEKKSFVQTNNQATDNDYLQASLKNPVSAYEIQAGTLIPAILITGIDSDLPGQITAQVRENVYDTVSGQYLLIPQGAKLTGLYDSQVAYGQERVLVVWKRILFPNGQSLDLQGMPGIDLSGYAGFNDQVNNHYGKIFGSVILMSILSAGAQLSQPQQTANNPNASPTVGQTLGQSLGTNVANTGTMITSKNINIQPTLQIRPGYLFNVSVTKDIVLPRPYVATPVIGNDSP